MNAALGTGRTCGSEAFVEDMDGSAEIGFGNGECRGQGDAIAHGDFEAQSAAE